MPTVTVEMMRTAVRVRARTASPEEKAALLSELAAERKLVERLRELEIPPSTYYGWKRKYGGMEVSDARKLKALEEENRRLKHLVADLTLDVQMLKAVNARKW